MNKDIFNILNKTYKPMWDKSIEIRNTLKKEGFTVTIGFYNNHYVKYENDFLVEHYPIPVISITGIGDIGVDFDSIWIEMKLDKQRAVLLDYPNLAKNYNMEVYGAEDFLNDFYNESSDPHKIADKLKNSDESQICITFYFNIDSNIEEFVDLIKSTCAKKE